MLFPQVVLSFHACGCNVGDTCTVTLPPWVLEIAEREPDVLYTDRRGYRNDEYLSLGVDDAAVLAGRTPLACYEDFMEAFRGTFAEYLGSVITEVRKRVWRRSGGAKGPSSSMGGKACTVWSCGWLCNSALDGC